MRRVALAAVLLVLCQPVLGAVTSEIDPRASLGVVQQWIYNYRAKPDYAHVPAAVRVLFHSQAFKEPENAGIYLGFIAGAIGSNPAKAEQLVNNFFPVPPEDEWVIVRAIAFSGLPDWRNLLRKVAVKMPGRQMMINAYLAGTLPTLTEIPLEAKEPGAMDKFKAVFTKNPFAKDDKKIKLQQSFAANQDLLDMLWGYYFATGSYRPILRIIAMLPWSKDRDSVEKLTLGSTAKYTLANYAAREPDLLEMLKRTLDQQPKNIEPILREVIHAAETVNVAALHREKTAAVEKLKREGPEYKKELSTWGQVGVGAIAVGCVAAAALGQVEVGIPCVIGGAGSSGGVSLWGEQKK